MTLKQEARCDALAKRIAELAPNGAWAVQGMACRDPESEEATIWRRVENCTWHGASVTDFLSWLIHDDESIAVFKECASLRDAIANGPDWRDLATLNSLLGDEGTVDRGMYSGAWDARCTKYSTYGETRPEAILAAKVAELEAKP